MATVPQFRIERSTRTSRAGLLLFLIAIAALVSLPLWGGAANMRLIVEISYYLALAETWNLLAGYAGLVSIGQQGFVGLGGYALVFLTVIANVPPLIALPLAGVFAAIVALPTALIVFRLRGAYFAIGTWVMAEVFRLLIAQFPALGGGTGMSLPVSVITAVAESRSTRELIIYYIALAVGLGSVLLVFFWLRSRQGMALTAIRDSEPAAASIGVNGYRTKLAAFVVAALFTGFVGAVAYLEKIRISPNAAFSVIDWTADVLFIVIIGGIGSIEGPIIGTVIFFALRGFLADYGAAYMILLGAVAVVVMLVAPQGIWGIVARRFDLHFFPVQRRVRLLGPAAAPPSR
jgi:branched-chain amino acid transport system permease protein